MGVLCDVKRNDCVSYITLGEHTTTMCCCVGWRVMACVNVLFLIHSFCSLLFLHTHTHIHSTKPDNFNLNCILPVELSLLSSHLKKRLDMALNALRRTILTQFGQLTALETLSLNDNFLTENLPAQLSNLGDNIKEFSLREYNITYSILLLLVVVVVI